MNTSGSKTAIGMLSGLGFDFEFAFDRVSLCFLPPHFSSLPGSVCVCAAEDTDWLSWISATRRTCSSSTNHSCHQDATPVSDYPVSVANVVAQFSHVLLGNLSCFSSDFFFALQPFVWCAVPACAAEFCIKFFDRVLTSVFSCVWLPVCLTAVPVRSQWVLLKSLKLHPHFSHLRLFLVS